MRTVIKVYNHLDMCSSYIDDDGKKHYQCRAMESGKVGKVYPDSSERGYKEGVIDLESRLMDEINIDVNRSNVEFEGQFDINCVEYIDSDDPDIIHMKCAKYPSAKWDFIRSFYMEDQLREKIPDEMSNEIEGAVHELVAMIPDVVYHKTDMEHLSRLLKTGKSSNTIFCTSDKLLTSCKLGLGDRPVTIEMRTDDSCPIPEWKAFRKARDTIHEVFDIAHSLDNSEVIRMADDGEITEDELEDRYIGKSDIEALFQIVFKKAYLDRFGKECWWLEPSSFISMDDIRPTILAEEREITLRPRSGYRPTVRKEDIIAIIPETECGGSYEDIVSDLKANGLDDYVHLVRRGFEPSDIVSRFEE